jgi:hypothetical protein
MSDVSQVDVTAVRKTGTNQTDVTRRVHLGHKNFSDFKITVTAFLRPRGRIGKRNNTQEKHGKKNAKMNEVYMMRKVKRRRKRKGEMEKRRGRRERWKEQRKNIRFQAFDTDIQRVHRNFQTLSGVQRPHVLWAKLVFSPGGKSVRA